MARLMKEELWKLNIVKTTVWIDKNLKTRVFLYVKREIDRGELTDERWKTSDGERKNRMK